MLRRASGGGLINFFDEVGAKLVFGKPSEIFVINHEGELGFVTGHFKTSQCGSIQNQPPCGVGFQEVVGMEGKLAVGATEAEGRVATSLRR